MPAVSPSHFNGIRRFAKAGCFKIDNIHGLLVQILLKLFFCVYFKFNIIINSFKAFDFLLVHEFINFSETKQYRI